MEAYEVKGGKGFRKGQEKKGDVGMKKRTGEVWRAVGGGGDGIVTKSMR